MGPVYIVENEKQGTKLVWPVFWGAIMLGRVLVNGSGTVTCVTRPFFIYHVKWRNVIFGFVEHRLIKLSQRVLSRPMLTFS